MAKSKGKTVCYVCGSGKYVDNHHYDCREGTLSPETVPLCRRCHRTYHMYRGIHMFEDEYLDKAIEIENKRREIWNHQPNCVNPFPLLTRADIKRSDYWNKTHGLPETKERRGSQTPAFVFHLPKGEPLCGWDWVNEHLYDLIDYVPRIEIVSPSFNLMVEIDSKKKLKDTIKAIKQSKR